MRIVMLYCCFYCCLISCDNEKKNINGEKGVELRKGICVIDTSYLVSILPSTGNDGGAVNYSFYKGKFMTFEILNNTSEIVYLYSRGYINSPVDSLLYRALSIDSVFVSGRYMEQIKKGIDENFETFGDSILPMQSKMKMLLNLSSGSINCDQIKGTFYYGLKGENGKMLHKTCSFQF